MYKKRIWIPKSDADLMIQSGCSEGLFSAPMRDNYGDTHVGLDIFVESVHNLAGTHWQEVFFYPSGFVSNLWLEHYIGKEEYKTTRPYLIADFDWLSC